MAKMKQVKRESTVGGAIADAFSDIQSLRDEMQEWRDNMEEKFSHTDKYQTISDTTDTLDQHADDEPSVPDFPEGIDGLEDKVCWTDYVKYGNRQSRATRAGLAANALNASAEFIRNMLEKLPDDHKDKGDWEELADKCEEVAGDVEGCEFPGMYG